MNRRAGVGCLLLLAAGLACLPPPRLHGMDYAFKELSSRALARGGAFCGESGGLSSLGYNPAGLTGVRSFTAAFTHNASYDDLSHDWIAAAGKAGPVALALEFQDSRMATFPSYDETGVMTGEISVSSQAGGLSAAYDLPGGIAGFGMRIRLFGNRLAGYSNWGGAGDLGGRVSIPGAPVHLGLCLQNAGQQTAFIAEADQLPLQLRGGLAAVFFPVPKLSLKTGCDLLWPFRTGLNREGRLGLEAVLFDKLAFSTGVLISDKKTRATFGAGFMIDIFTLSYAYLPDAVLGDTHQFSLDMAFPSSGR